MKLLRYGAAGKEKPGILDVDGQLRDLSSLYTDIDGPALAAGLVAELHDMDLDKLPIVTGTPRLGPCISGVGKMLCIGLNYRDHAAEAGMPIPNEPIVFMKATSAINGPHDDIIIPRGSQKTDWEVELGVVISQSVRYVSVADALEYVAGYCVINDLSERAFQLEGTGQWVKGKSCDSFGPLGPWLVSRDEVPDPQDLMIWLEVNGKRYQNSTTANMIFGVAEIVSYLSHYMTLCPGDVISTGTPAGVGMGLSPPVYLRAGDHLRLGIGGLGEQYPICTASI